MDQTKNEYIYQNFADRLRLCAKRVGSGDELSRRSGIPRSTLETYLKGKAEPKVSRLVALAKAAGVSVGWLAAGEGKIEAEKDWSAEDQSAPQSPYDRLWHVGYILTAHYPEEVSFQTICHALRNRGWFQSEEETREHLAHLERLDKITRRGDNYRAFSTHIQIDVPTISNPEALRRNLHNDLETIIERLIIEPKKARIQQMFFSLPPGKGQKLGEEIFSSIQSVTADYTHFNGSEEVTFFIGYAVNDLTKPP